MKHSSDQASRPKFPMLAIAALALSLGGTLATTAHADDGCQKPDQPVVPDGSEATMEAMLAGQKAVKAFQASNMEYMQCLEARYSAAAADAKNASDENEQALAKADYDKSIDAYNAAVSAEEAVAEDFNVALRAYKAANK